MGECWHIAPYEARLVDPEYIKVSKSPWICVFTFINTQLLIYNFTYLLHLIAAKITK